MRVLAVAFATSALLAAQTLPPAAATKVDFEKHILPILQQNCHSCHGAEVQQSGLRLDRRQPAMRGGDYGPVIIPGKSAESKLIRRVVNGDGGMLMPPSGSLSKADIGLLRAWIDQGADFRLELKDEPPAPPVEPKVSSLISAIRLRQDAAVEKMLQAEPALAQAKDAANSTALHHAAGFGSLATMKLLLDQGAKIDARNKRASTPLHWAMHDEAKVRFLLDRGAGLNTKQSDGRTPLYQAASLYNGHSILRLLLEKGADPNLATAAGQTPLMAAAIRGDDVAIKLLLEAKAAVDTKNGAGSTALISAATNGNPAAVRLLLEKGADAKVLNKRQESALGFAATAGNEESVRLLLAAGAPVNVQDDRGYSPLMFAAASDTIPTGAVKRLLAAGADPKATGEGETAGSLAAKRGPTEVTRLLGVTAPAPKPFSVRTVARHTVPEAVSKALTLLEVQSHNFIRIGGCNSCHAQDLPSAAAGLARSRGLPAPKSIEQLSVLLQGTSTERVMDFNTGAITTVGWELFDYGINQQPKDEYTDSVVRFLKAMQGPDGLWKVNESRRPPLNVGAYQTTALAAYALRHYTPTPDQADTDRALARAAATLSQMQPTAMQDRAFHLLALAWTNAPAASIEKAVRALVAMQYPDGSWSQMPTMDADAFATGQALFALNVGGKLPTTDRVYQKGVAYLRRTQAADGSWHVRSRSIEIQPYFESGFPYGHDQWISAAGTSWAVMALSLTVEPTSLSRAE